MLERKRKTKTYGPVVDGEDEADLELGEGTGSQENGVVREQTLEEQVDNWDENAEDWDGEEDNGDTAEGEAIDAADAKKRND